MTETTVACTCSWLHFLTEMLRIHSAEASFYLILQYHHGYAGLVRKARYWLIEY